jgi:hypothetical protein
VARQLVVRIVRSPMLSSLAAGAALLDGRGAGDLLVIRRGRVPSRTRRARGRSSLGWLASLVNEAGPDVVQPLLRLPAD